MYHSYIIRNVWEYIPKSIPSVCTTIFNRIAGLCFCVICLMLYINGFVSTSCTNWWINFLNFRIRSRIFGWKPKNIQKNSEAWILIKFQCVVYQWIRLNELYKVMKRFFSNFKLVFEILTEKFDWKPKNIQTNSEAWILIKVQCVTHINGFVSTSFAN